MKKYTRNKKNITRRNKRYRKSRKNNTKKLRYGGVPSSSIEIEKDISAPRRSCRIRTAPTTLLNELSAEYDIKQDSDKKRKKIKEKKEKKEEIKQIAHKIDIEKPVALASVKYDWNDIIMFKAIRTLKIIIQQKLAGLAGSNLTFVKSESISTTIPLQSHPICTNPTAVNKLLNTPDNFSPSKYDDKYGWNLLDKCKYQELLNYFYNEYDYTSLLTLNNYLDQIFTNFIIDYKTIYFKFGTMDYRVRNEFNLWKLKMIDGFYQFKIFFQLRELLTFYSNPDNKLTTKAITRIQNMYQNNLANKEWCNNILNNDERSVLINKIGANPEEFTYTPLLTDYDLKQCSDSCQVELSDDDLLIIEQKQEVIDLLTQSFDKLNIDKQDEQEGERRDQRRDNPYDDSSEDDDDDSSEDDDDDDSYYKYSKDHTKEQRQFDRDGGSKRQHKKIKTRKKIRRNKKKKIKTRKK